MIHLSKQKIFYTIVALQLLVISLLVGYVLKNNNLIPKAHAATTTKYSETWSANATNNSARVCVPYTNLNNSANNCSAAGYVSGWTVSATVGASSYTETWSATGTQTPGCATGYDCYPNVSGPTYVTGWSVSGTLTTP